MWRMDVLCGVVIALLLGVLALARPLWAGGADLYEKAVFTDGDQKLNYRLLRPAKIEDGAKYPLVLFLHGAGERGDNNSSQLVHGSSLFVKNREKFPAFVIFPQVPNNKKWVEVDWSGKKPHESPKEPSDTTRLTKKMLDEFIKKNPVDPDRIYVMGLSMGGFGAWDFAQRYPDFVAAAAPICGGADDSTAAKIKHIPIWAFHGAKDTAVWPERSRSMVDAVKKAGGNIRYSEYEKVGHDSWNNAFAEPEILTWMFAQKRTK